MQSYSVACFTIVAAISLILAIPVDSYGLNAAAGENAVAASGSLRSRVPYSTNGRNPMNSIHTRSAEPDIWDHNLLGRSQGDPKQDVERVNKDVVKSFLQKAVTSGRTAERQRGKHNPDFQSEIIGMQKRSPYNPGSSSSSESYLSSSSAVSLGPDPYGYGRPPPMTTVQSRIIVDQVGKRLRKQQGDADETYQKARDGWYQISRDFEQKKLTLEERIQLDRDPQNRMRVQDLEQKWKAGSQTRRDKGVDIEHIGMMDKKTQASMKKNFSPVPRPSAELQRWSFHTNKEYLQGKKEEAARIEEEKKEKKAQKEEKVRRIKVEAAHKKERILKNSVKSAQRETKTQPTKNFRLPKNGKFGLGRSKSDPTHMVYARKRLGSPKEELNPQKPKGGRTAEKATQTEDLKTHLKVKGFQTGTKDGPGSSYGGSPTGKSSSTEVHKRQGSVAGDGDGHSRSKRAANILGNTRDRLKNALKSCIRGGCLRAGSTSPRRLKRRSMLGVESGPSPKSPTSGRQAL